MAPRTWVILSDKRGDNGQVETIVEALGWPVERKTVQMLPRYVLGKPRYRHSLSHIDPERSDPIEPPWTDLIITVGRRPSMVALWVRRQSGNRTKIVLVGKPSGHMPAFALVVASAENQMPPLPNFLPTTLPLMRIAEADVEAGLEEEHPLALRAVVVGDGEEVQRLRRVHRPVAEVELGHRGSESRGGGEATAQPPKRRSPASPRPGRM